jgi:hypothetical protein
MDDCFANTIPNGARGSGWRMRVRLRDCCALHCSEPRTIRLGNRQTEPPALSPSTALLRHERFRRNVRYPEFSLDQDR